MDSLLEFDMRKTVYRQNLKHFVSKEADYIPDKSATNVWNNRSSFSSSILEQAYIANKFVTVEHFKESEHLLAVLESYQAEQKKQII